MVLGKKELIECVKDGKLGFTPELDAFQIQPNSVDLRIGLNFYVPEGSSISDQGRAALEPDYLTKGYYKDHFKLIKLKPGQYFEILPHELVLASSLEKVEFKTGDLMAVLYPRSSMVRRGFVIQGGVVDVMYKGYLVIPVLNGTNQNLKLYVGERAYQLVFHKVTEVLSEEEALKHGVTGAKYAESTAYSLEARTDSDPEIDFIRKGDLNGLKAKFRL